MRRVAISGHGSIMAVTGGDTLAKFLQQFPTVTREQTIAVLELAKAAVNRSTDEAAA
jgi:uncharacterized protein (DUF433 family)